MNQPGESSRLPASHWLADRIYEPAFRGRLLQVLLLAALAAGVYLIVTNTAANLARQNVASGFGFLERTSGFDIAQKLIAYENTSTFGRAFWVGLANTLLVSGLGIVLATALGFVIGLGRLSPNWLVQKLATVYVEIVRNVPLLLQLLFWYFAMLRAAPMPLDSTRLPFGSFLNRRGLYLPVPVWNPALEALAVAIVAAAALAILLHVVARERRRETGASFNAGLAGGVLMIALPLLAVVSQGSGFAFDLPRIGRFNVEGGLNILPEFGALLIGLSVYTAAFIAEIVRAGIQGIAKGQYEAATALGLNRGQTLRLVVVPQALRIVIPPLTNQYLNLTKNSSLAVAIGYPDLVSVFSGTVLNLTNQAVEVILITMAVYLSLSLMTSLAMNRLNARWALVER